MTIERYVSAKEIIQALGISRSRAYQLMREMPRVKLGRTVRISEAAFKLWLEKRTVPVTEPIPYRLPPSVELAGRKLLLRQRLKRAAAKPIDESRRIKLTRRRD
jgi:excisionase family DNA binding protein